MKPAPAGTEAKADWPSGSASYFSFTFSPKFRMRRSSNKGFRLISAWPYQYTRGRRALEERAVGAEVAAEPRGFAGEQVGRGECTDAAEIAPGQDHPPCFGRVNVHICIQTICQCPLTSLGSTFAKSGDQFWPARTA